MTECATPSDTTLASPIGVSSPKEIADGGKLSLLLAAGSLLLSISGLAYGLHTAVGTLIAVSVLGIATAAYGMLAGRSTVNASWDEKQQKEIPVNNKQGKPVDRDNAIIGCFICFIACGVSFAVVIAGVIAMLS